MADNKKYYYLKLKENFFDSPEIKVLEAMQNGYKYSNLLLKLYLKSLRFEGMVRLNEYIPYSIDMISAITGIDSDTVRVAFDIFKKLKLIEILDDGTIFMLEIQNFIGQSSTEADRIRNYRKKIDDTKKVVQGKCTNVQQLNDKSTPEIEKEIEKEKELQQDNNNNSSSSLKGNLDIFKHFEKCGFIVTAILMEQISADIEVYTAKWLMDAATEAMNRGKINNYKYVLGILQNWTSNGRNESNGNGATSKNNREEPAEWIGL
ncbi:MAG: phage replisome organizer N-terminal domain-containing protein [Clostridium celatum]|nr:phage replisome organizer N-terminal domain-containing protein [Clostridium celatum]